MYHSYIFLFNSDYIQLALIQLIRVIIKDNVNNWLIKGFCKWHCTFFSDSDFEHSGFILKLWWSLYM